MKKKGSLSLSIEAIVIIVIAFVVLGLGLGFVRGLFGDIIGISESTFQKISKELSTNLATSGAPLLFSQSRLTIERGEDKLEGFGVRNDGNLPIKYGIKIETFNCPDGEKTEGKCNDVSGWFEYFGGDQQYSVKPAERQVNKVQINIPRGATTGLYLLKISAYTGAWPEEGDCLGDYNDEAMAGCTAFGQTELFLTVA